MLTPQVAQNLSPSLALTQKAASTYRVRLLLASLAIVGPLPLVLLERLPLPVRGVSAVACGLAVLLCGSYLVAQAIDRLGLPRSPRSPR